MIVVAGKLKIVSGRRAEFLAGSYSAMVLARSTPGCLDFVVAPDPIEEDRVKVFELWESDTQLNAFRGEGPEDTLNNLIESADVYQRELMEG